MKRKSSTRHYHELLAWTWLLNYYFLILFFFIIFVFWQEYNMCTITKHKHKYSMHTFKAWRLLLLVCQNWFLKLCDNYYPSCVALFVYPLVCALAWHFLLYKISFCASLLERMSLSLSGTTAVRVTVWIMEDFSWSGSSLKDSNCAVLESC